MKNCSETAKKRIVKFEACAQSIGIILQTLILFGLIIEMLDE
jgi:hypothetical protein